MEEFKEELLDQEEVREARRTVGEVKSELTTPSPELGVAAQHSDKEPKPEAAVPEEGDEPTVDSPPDEDGEQRPKDGRELPNKEEAPPSAERARTE